MDRNAIKLKSRSRIHFKVISNVGAKLLQDTSMRKTITISTEHIKNSAHQGQRRAHARHPGRNHQNPQGHQEF